VGWKVGSGIAGFSVQGLARLKARCRPGLPSPLRLKVLFLAHLGCWQNSVPFGCRTEALVFWLAVGQGFLLAPRNHLQVLAV